MPSANAAVSLRAEVPCAGLSRSPRGPLSKGLKEEEERAAGHTTHSHSGRLSARPLLTDLGPGGIFPA